jgi:branched-chain amino acid transport system substrate-binding protein
MYKKKSGDEMDDTAARQMQGFLVLVDAIDRAGSTDPAKIQAALKATDLKADQLMIGYKGVKFDDKGQNILASGRIIQLQDGENYVAVWPKDCLTRAGSVGLNVIASEAKQSMLPLVEPWIASSLRSSQ